MNRAQKFLTAATLLALPGCSSTSTSTTKPAADCPYCHGSMAGMDAPTTVGGSVYSQADVWQKDDGGEIRLHDLKGRPRIVAMVFTRCEGICTATLMHLKEIEASLPPKDRDRVGFVIVTLDPAHDSPRDLHHYRMENDLPAHRWTLLRGSPAATQTLAGALGIRFRTDAAGLIRHDSRILVIDADGAIIDVQDGSVPNLARSIERAQAAIGLNE